MWQNLRETMAGLFVAALQLTSKPMPRRQQCLGCLRAHHHGGVYCAACSAVLWLVTAGEIAIGCVVLAAFTLGLWMVWQ